MVHLGHHWRLGRLCLCYKWILIENPRRSEITDSTALLSLWRKRCYPKLPESNTSDQDSAVQKKQFVPCAASCCVVDWQRGMKAKLEVNSQWASPFLDQVRAWHWPDFLPVPGAKLVRFDQRCQVFWFGFRWSFSFRHHKRANICSHVTVSGLENH